MQLLGDMSTDKDLSGGTLVGEWLVLVSDESRSIILLQALGEDFAHVKTIELLHGDKEFDLECAATDGEFVYVAGSHSAVRKQLPGLIGTVKRQPQRDGVFRFRLQANGTISDVEHRSLRAAIDSHEVLAPFAELASKENGIDIEGLAAREGKLFFGFRGPVLRDNWVPVLVTKFDKPSNRDVRYVQLGGRGIRDLVAVTDGLLVLAGPVGDGDADYQLWHWNGVCGLREPTKLFCKQLTGLHQPKQVKLEGMILLGENVRGYELLLLSDGSTGGSPQRIVVER